MRGFNPKAAGRATDNAQRHAPAKKKARAPFANGGPVRGPGTGTSDDIEDEVPEGTYIMPADSTQAVGEDNLSQMGTQGFQPKGVPVNLSNGEYKLPPEQVHAVGVQTLDQMKNATHTPVDQGFAPERHLFFANGGVVDDEARRQAAINQIPTEGPAAPPPARVPQPTQATPAPATLYMQDRAKEFGDQVQAGNYAGAAGTAVRTGVQGLGMHLLDIGNAVTQPLADAGGRAVGGLLGTDNPDGTIKGAAQATPAAAPAAVKPSPPAAGAPAVPPAVTPTGPATAGDVPAQSAPALAPGSKELSAGVYQHGRGQYSDNAAGMGFAPGFTGQPTAQSLSAADVLASRNAPGQTSLTAAAGFRPPTVQAPTVLHSGNSWQARNDLRNLEVSASSITNNGGRFDRTRGRNAAQDAYRAALQNDLAMRRDEPAAQLRASEASARDATTRYQSDNTLRGNLADVQARGFDSQARRAIDSRRLDIDAGRAEQEARAKGFDIRRGERQEALERRYEAAKTQQERAAVAQQIRDLSGKATNPRDDLMTVGGGQEWDATANVMRNVPQRIYDARTRQFVGQTGQGGGPAAVPVSGPAQPTSKAEYDALPKGNQYVKNGVTYVKS